MCLSKREIILSWRKNKIKITDMGRGIVHFRKNKEAGVTGCPWPRGWVLGSEIWNLMKEPITENSSPSRILMVPTDVLIFHIWPPWIFQLPFTTIFCLLQFSQSIYVGSSDTCHLYSSEVFIYLIFVEGKRSLYQFVILSEPWSITLFHFTIWKVNISELEGLLNCPTLPFYNT